MQIYQVVKVFAYLSDDSREGWSEQLLNVGGPGAVPVVSLQVVDPLRVEKVTKKKKHLYSYCLSRRKMRNYHLISYIDGRVPNVHGVVRVRRLDVELQDVVDERRIDEKRAKALHHSGLTAQDLKHTVEVRTQRRVFTMQQKIINRRTDSENIIKYERKKASGLFIYSFSSKTYSVLFVIKTFIDLLMTCWLIDNFNSSGFFCR